MRRRRVIFNGAGTIDGYSNEGTILMLRAMIVDDEAPARSELRFLLEQTGKIGSINEASSVRSAIEMLMENRVDVVFLDISMPGASGLQLAEALHRLKNPPAVVFVTAYSTMLSRHLMWTLWTTS